MSLIEEFIPRRVYYIEAPEDVDLIDYLKSISNQIGIRRAAVMTIGSLKKAKVGYLNVSTGKYEAIDLDEFLELVSALGYIYTDSNRDANVHLHVTLGRRNGSTVGGHLIEGVVYKAFIHLVDLCPLRVP